MVDGRRGSDLVWLWLWRRLAVAALIQPLAWELPYDTGVALKRKKKKKRISHYSPSPLPPGHVPNSLLPTCAPR